MKKSLLIWAIFLNSFSIAQYDVGAGMGLNFFSAPDLRDYINSNFRSNEEVPAFNTSADFFFEIDYNLNEGFQLGIEYTYNIFSYNNNLVANNNFCTNKNKFNI